MMKYQPGCPLGTGCEVILSSRMSKVAGVPVAIFGCLYFLFCMAMSFRITEKRLVILHYFGIAYLLIATVLTALGELKLMAFCSLCLMTHTCAVVVLVCTSILRDRKEIPSLSRKAELGLLAVVFLFSAALLLKPSPKKLWKLDVDAILAKSQYLHIKEKPRVINIFLDVSCGYSLTFLHSLEKKGAIPANAIVVVRPTKMITADEARGLAWVQARKDLVIIDDPLNYDIARRLSIVRLPAALEVHDGMLTPLPIDVVGGRIE